MSAIVISRIVGFIVFGLIGAFSGISIHNFLTSFWATYPFTNGATIAFSVVIFALIGFAIMPLLTIKPFLALKRTFSKSSPQELISGVVGLIIGLLVGGLFAYALSLLPRPFGQIAPVLGVFLSGYLGSLLFTTRHEDFANLFRNITSRSKGKTQQAVLETQRRILVDTSAIIDGRIADIAKTGFLSGGLVVPRFVLNELQYVSDSADSLRRQRGRRGLDVLSELQGNELIPVTISDIDVEGVREVDDRLVVLARQMNSPILTNDYNLNRVAELQGVKVLNVNDLANAVKVVILPGESFKIDIIQEGKEYEQGVGYLDDGTMVVIENGQRYLGKQISVTVTKILQTSAGRMIFAKPD